MACAEQQRELLPTESLKDLAEQKEKEWRELQHLRVQSLEVALQEKHSALKEQRSKFDKLKEDFKYNLRLLGERDAELARYDALFADLRTKASSKEAELSELKIQMADLQTALAREAKSRDEFQSHYELRVRQKQAELEQYRSVKDAEIESERQELETFKRSLERKLREAESETDTQRRELTAGFEEALRKREHEFRVRMDEMNTTVLAHELKVKLLGKDVEALKAAQAANSEEWEEASGSSREREKEMKQLQWQLADTQAMKDAQIHELEARLEQMEQRRKRLADDFSRKHAELDRSSCEKDAQLTKLRDMTNDREHHLEETIQSLRTQLDEAEVTRRQLEWTVADLQKEKESKIEMLTIELTEVKAKWDSNLAAMSHDSVSRDLELQALHDTEGKLNTEVKRLKQDVERYKNEVRAGLEREEALQQGKAQAQVDWQRQCEDLERIQYERSEDLVRRLTKARDEAVADLREKEREWQEKEDRLRVVSGERDRAEATLRQHGLCPDYDIDLSQSSTSQVRELQQQNETLRDVVHQMRRQMEALGSQMPTDQSTVTRSAELKPVASDDYVKNIENELIQLKAKYNTLEMTKKKNDLDTGAADGGHKSIASDNPLLLRHIEELNSTIGQLRGEKVELTAQVRKQQARLQHLERTVTELGKQPREKQALVEQLEYKLSAETRRQEALVGSLRHRVSELEVELTEARKEADEYHRVNIERNLEVTALSNQVSALKMELASGRPTVSFGAQELLIQQLQDELKRLLKCHQEVISGDSLTDTGQATRGHGLTTNMAMADMHKKLRQAAKHISTLTREKQQLIEMGNRLRAELNKNGLRAPQSSCQHLPASHDTDYSKLVTSQSDLVETGSQSVTARSNQLSQLIQTKLSQLEKLQYQLTKQELAFVQKGEGHSMKVMPMTLAMSSSGECSTTDEDAGINSRVDTRGRQPLVASDRPVASRQEEPDQHRVTPHSPHLRTSLSSLGGESLQEIWGMLDYGLSPKPITPTAAGDGPHQNVTMARHSDPWAVTGRRVNHKSQQDVTGPGKNTPVVKLGPGRRNQRKAKIRNYNIKDF
ncbi:Coiled-coil domain-containing protein 57 [Lamellibrachia satsuma]|nr:Coiled-coil domain-containing protein 57 [Lamellibrachia satsuma]